MNEAEVAEAVRDWARAELPELVAGYDYPVASKLGGLPDCAAWVQRKVVRPSDERFAFAGLEQVWLRIFEVELSIQNGVEVGGSPEQAEQAARDAHLALMDFGDRLERAIMADATLGGRLGPEPPAFCSPQLEIDYSTPFAEYEDGTRGRFMVLQLAIAELVPDPS